MPNSSDINIKTVRDDLGLSQTEFAKAFGVDQSTVSTWETKGLPRSVLVRESVARRIEALQADKAST